MEDSKKEYEISFILTAPEAEKSLADVLAKNGAEVYFQKPAAEVRLAYKIKRHTSGWFGFYHFRMNPENVKEVRQALQLTPDVLRSLILTPPVKIVTEQPMSTLRPSADSKKPTAPILSNEALSEKLEEILK